MLASFSTKPETNDTSHCCFEFIHPLNLSTTYCLTVGDCDKRGNYKPDFGIVLKNKLRLFLPISRYKIFLHALVAQIKERVM